MKQEEVVEEVREEVDNGDWETVVETVTGELYNSEDNYNNADKTTGMTVHSHEKIEAMVEEALNQLKGESDRCSECATVLQDTDYVTTSEGRGEFWGCPSQETMVCGYHCSTCGHHENY